MAEPPVLVDIGASKNINPAWKLIAKIAIGVFFDADERDFRHIENDKGLFKKTFIFNRAVTDQDNKNEVPQDFFLTKNPHCSSLLEPNHKSLGHFLYADLFTVIKKTPVETIGLNQALSKAGLKRIDWFKTDSQGVDLRLYRSLAPETQNRALVLEFEPGLIDGYVGEDKATDILMFMQDKKHFFLSDFKIDGAVRMTQKNFDAVFSNRFMRRLAKKTIKKTPGWAEIKYFNDFSASEPTARDMILAWLFATISNRHELAYTYAAQGLAKLTDPIFTTLKSYSRHQLRQKAWRIKNLFNLFRNF